MLKNPTTNNVLQTVANTPAIADNAILVQNISANTSYSVVINAIYDDNAIYTSSSVTFNTKGPATNIQTPANYITNTSGKVTFKNALVIPPNPYTVTVNNQTTYNISVVNDADHVYSLTLNGILLPNTFYTARIDSSYNNMIVSDSITWATESAPVDISINNITDVSANISFQPGNNMNATYNLVVQNKIYGTENSVEIKPIGLKRLNTGNENIAWNSGIFISTDETFIMVYNNSAKLYTISTDSGNTWTASKTFLNTSDTVYCFAVNNAGRYLYSSNTGIYYSWDSGITWLKSNAPSIFTSSFLKNNRAGNIAVAIDVSNTDIYYSADYGKTWFYSDVFLPTTVSQLEVSADGNAIYLLSSHLFKSVDYGRTWVNILDIASNIYEIATINRFYISTNGNFIYLIVDTVKSYISTNGGNNFNLVTTTIPNILNCVFTFSTDGKYGYHLGADGNFYYSTDYGNIWINSLVYSTQYNILLKTADSGDYAVFCNDISGIQMIYMNPVQPTKTYGINISLN